MSHTVILKFDHTTTACFPSKTPTLSKFNVSSYSCRSYQTSRFQSCNPQIFPTPSNPICSESRTVRLASCNFREASIMDWFMSSPRPCSSADLPKTVSPKRTSRWQLSFFFRRSPRYFLNMKLERERFGEERLVVKIDGVDLLNHNFLNFLKSSLIGMITYIVYI